MGKAAVDSAAVLFQTALIESGYEIADPSALVKRVYKLMSKELGVDPDAPLKEVEIPDEEEAEEESEGGDEDKRTAMLKRKRKARTRCEHDVNTWPLCLLYGCQRQQAGSQTDRCTCTLLDDSCKYSLSPPYRYRL